MAENIPRKQNNFSEQRTIIAIDLKSYYASVECTSRKLDALTTNLVVADESRTEKTICLAVSPALKAYGISGRARLFEVVQKVKEINARRLQRAIRLGVAVRDPETGKMGFSSSSFDAEALASDPSLELAYIIAPPRMLLYEEISARIVGIYLKYVSEQDLHVYSIDEVFMDVSAYLRTYGMTAHELAITMIREVLYTTGITATAGIGTNLYLAKIAMDIVAKHVPADKDGVRIAELDERSYREKLWCHRPLTDFWRVGKGIARRMERLGCFTMGDIARLSLTGKQYIYKALGKNAELLIDHAWGWEPTTISTIKSYRPQTTSLTSGQVLSEPYDWEKGKLIVKEMTELLVLDLVKKGLITKKVTLTVGYDRESLVEQEDGYIVRSTGKRYTGTVGKDYYGRIAPTHAHGTGNIDRWTNSTRRIQEIMMALYDRIVDSDLLIRRVTIVAADLIREDAVPAEPPEQLSLLVDYEELYKQRAAEDKKDEKEKKLMKATLALQAKYGKNAVLKGMNFMDGGTTRERNSQIGGHRAGEGENDKGNTK